MRTDFYELKKEFVNKRVADANQFIDNVVYGKMLMPFISDRFPTMTVATIHVIR